MKPNYNIKLISSALLAARHSRKLTQQQVALKAGLGQAHVSRIESGSVNITLASLIDISRALGFELMLIPREFVPAVKALTRPMTNEAQDEPAYKPGDYEGQ